MARKPKFTTPTTPATVEQWALTKGAPVRGSGVPIDKYVRAHIRFWLTVSGIPLEQAVTLSMAQMSEVWHDTSGAALNSIATGSTGKV